MFSKNELPILGILRGIEEKDIKPIVDICKNSGIHFLEVTLNTPNAPTLIRNIIQVKHSGLIVGAGTILGMADLHKALSAGAEFIVTPSVIEEVIEYCANEKIDVIPGALTPTEVHKAWASGAKMIKLFPASVFGPSYIRALKGPFNTFKFMAVGGVDEENISSFFNCGADAVAFGAGIIRPEWLRNNRYDLIESKLLSLIRAYRDSVS